MKNVRVLIFTAWILIIFAVQQANAFIVWGHGEKIYKVCNLPDEAQLELKAYGLPLGGSVGYKLHTFQLFWMPVAQWGGQFVFYKDDRYVELNTGVSLRDSADDFGLTPSAIKKPILAYFPWGWLIFSPVIFIWFASKQDGRKERAFMKVIQGDVRYMKALEILSKNPTEEGKQQAIDYLCEQGIAEDKAEQTLARVVQHVAQQ
jgi:hypothetical protein